MPTSVRNLIQSSALEPSCSIRLLNGFKIPHVRIWNAVDRGKLLEGIQHALQLFIAAVQHFCEYSHEASRGPGWYNYNYKACLLVYVKPYAGVQLESCPHVPCKVLTTL